MNQEEIEEEVSEIHMRLRPQQPLFAVPSVVAIGISVGSSMIAFGVLVNKVDGNSDQITVLEQQSRNMTPQAAAEVAAIKQVDASLQQQVAQIRVDSSERWSLISRQLDRIEEKVDIHMSGTHK